MPSATPEPFELFALRYATNSGRKLIQNALGADIHESGPDLDFFVWIAKRSDRTFVIDTGYDYAQGEIRQRPILRSPVEALRLLGIDAAKIDEVILTHLHFDHAGMMPAFGRACFHVQASEVAYATGPCMCHTFLRTAFDVEDVVHMVRLVYSGRINFHNGVTQLADGLTLHHIGGHTGGLQVVRVFTKRGWVVLASDAAHYYLNMERGLPFPIVQNIAGVLDGFKTINQLADTPDHIIPGHDPLVTRLYPAVSKELAGIAMRLDEPPAPRP